MLAAALTQQCEPWVFREKLPEKFNDITTVLGITLKTVLLYFCHIKCCALNDDTSTYTYSTQVDTFDWNKNCRS